MIGRSSRIGARMVSVEATVIRADGTREELGVVSFWHESWYRRVAWRTGRLVKQFGNRLRAMRRAK